MCVCVLLCEHKGATKKLLTPLAPLLDLGTPGVCVCVDVDVYHITGGKNLKHTPTQLQKKKKKGKRKKIIDCEGLEGVERRKREAFCLLALVSPCDTYTYSANCACVSSFLLLPLSLFCEQEEEESIPKTDTHFIFLLSLSFSLSLLFFKPP